MTQAGGQQRAGAADCELFHGGSPGLTEIGVSAGDQHAASKISAISRRLIDGDCLLSKHQQSASNAGKRVRGSRGIFFPSSAFCRP